MLVVVGLVLTGLGAASAAEEGWLGVMLQPLTDDIAQAMNLEKGTVGVLVTDVVDESPAEAAEITKGDVIVEIDGKSIESPDDAIAKVRSLAPGDMVKLVVLRDGKREVITAELGERGQYEKAEKAEEAGKMKKVQRTYDIEIEDEDQGIPGAGRCHRIKIPRVEKIIDDLGLGGGRIGIRLQGMSADLASYFGVAEGEGVLVIEVEEDSPAKEAGLLAGDVITKLDGDAGAACCPSRLAKEIRSHEPGDKVDLTLKRKGETRRLDVTVGEGGAMNLFINADDPAMCCPEFMGHGDQGCSRECMDRCMKGGMKGCMKRCMKGGMKDFEGMPEGMCKGDGPRKVMVMKSPEGVAMDEPLMKECMEMMGPGGHMDDLKAEIEQLRREIEKLKQDMEAMKK